MNVLDNLLKSPFFSKENGGENDCQKFKFKPTFKFPFDSI